MRALVACECSGRVRDALIEQGIDAWSCDIKPAAGRHICGDVVAYLDDGWDLLIGHPPCTWLSRAGIWKFTGSKSVVDAMVHLDRAVEFFHLLWSSPVPFVALENPLPHRFARQRIPEWSQVVQPHWFGDPVQKRTHLWLRNLPPLLGTCFSRHKGVFVDLVPPGPDQASIRSMTFPGMAKAMGNQWGRFVLSEKGIANAK